MVAAVSAVPAATTGPARLAPDGGPRARSWPEALPDAAGGASVVVDEGAGAVVTVVVGAPVVEVAAGELLAFTAAVAGG